MSGHEADARLLIFPSSLNRLHRSCVYDNDKQAEYGTRCEKIYDNTEMWGYLLWS